MVGTGVGRGVRVGWGGVEVGVFVGSSVGVLLTAAIEGVRVGTDVSKFIGDEVADVLQPPSPTHRIKTNQQEI